MLWYILEEGEMEPNGTLFQEKKYSPKEQQKEQSWERWAKLSQSKQEVHIREIRAEYEWINQS